MADEETTPKSTVTLGKGRMEAFSDGVLAIAITLLVLDVAIRPPGSPTDQFLRGWPSYVAYVVSFLTIGGAWIAHHGLTDGLDRVDRIFLRLNLLFLLVVAFLPFPTRLVAEAIEKTTAWQRMAAVVYGLTLLLIRLLFAALSAYVRRAHLRGPGVDDPDLLARTIHEAARTDRPASAEKPFE
ncbi:MAG: TMEM175 family protein [Acidimicrobiales bacterium]